MIYDRILKITADLKGLLHKIFLSFFPKLSLLVLF